MQDADTASMMYTEHARPTEEARSAAWSETDTVPKECVRCGYIARSEDDRDYHFHIHRLKDRRDRESAA